MVQPSPLDSLIAQMNLITTKLDAVSTQTTNVKKSADELKVSRKRTWRSITFIVLVTALDIFATLFAYQSLSTVHTLITDVTCPTDALFLKSFSPARGATYPGGLPAYTHDMHEIYEQYTVVLHCQPPVKDPTAQVHI